MEKFIFLLATCEVVVDRRDGTDPGFKSKTTTVGNEVGEATVV